MNGIKNFFFLLFLSLLIPLNILYAMEADQENQAPTPIIKRQNSTYSISLFEDCGAQTQPRIDLTAAPLDVQKRILGLAFVSSALELEHAKDLKLVCKKWYAWLTSKAGYFYDLEKSTSVEISYADLCDTTGTVVNSLQNNRDIASIKLYVCHPQDDTVRETCLRNIIWPGLKNKPFLRSIKIIGEFERDRVARNLSDFTSINFKVSSLATEDLVHIPSSTHCASLHQVEIWSRDKDRRSLVMLVYGLLTDDHFKHILPLNRSDSVLISQEGA